MDGAANDTHAGAHAKSGTGLRSCFKQDRTNRRLHIPYAVAVRAKRFLTLRERYVDARCRWLDAPPEYVAGGAPRRGHDL